MHLGVILDLCDQNKFISISNFMYIRLVVCERKHSDVQINPLIIQNYWVFGLCPSSGILKTRKHSITPVTEVSSFYGTQQSRCLPPHLRTEKGPFSETLCFLVSRILDDGQIRKASNSECYTPSSEPFRMYSLLVLIICA
jgi:hypothetical protein